MRMLVRPLRRFSCLRPPCLPRGPSPTAWPPTTMRGTIVEVTCFRQQGAATVSTPEQIGVRQEAGRRRRPARHPDRRRRAVSDHRRILQRTSLRSSCRSSASASTERRRSRHFQQLRLQSFRCREDRPSSKEVRSPRSQKVRLMRFSCLRRRRWCGSLDGCAKRARRRRPRRPTPVTFTKDVAPILQRSCQNCHRPDSNAPMSLITYEDARPYARSIKAKTTSRLMPPWHVERNIGIQKFKDDPSLTEQEIATIAAWVDQGAQKGDMAHMPRATDVRGRRRVAHRQARSHRRDSAAPCRPRRRSRCVDRLHRRQRAHRRPLRAGRGDEARAGRAHGDAPPADVSHSGRSRERKARRSGRRAAAADRDVPQRVRRRQERRHPSGRHRQADEGGLEGPLQHPLPLERQGDRRSVARRPEVLPEGLRAEVSPDLACRSRRPTASSIMPAGVVSRSDGYYRFDKPVQITAIQAHMHNHRQADVPRSDSAQQHARSSSTAWAGTSTGTRSTTTRTM